MLPADSLHPMRLDATVFTSTWYRMLRDAARHAPPTDSNAVCQWSLSGVSLKRFEKYVPVMSFKFMCLCLRVRAACRSILHTTFKRIRR